MARREFIQLAQTYDSVKHQVGGWYLSEKFNGMRAYWDGGWTRGKLTSQVPFANTGKDWRRLHSPYATGLWTRYGKAIFAPNWWLDQLPDFALDGELYAGRGKFQQVISTVKKYTPIDSEWNEIKYMIFDMPSDYMFLAPGRINNPVWSATFEDMRSMRSIEDPLNFRQVQHRLKSLNLYIVEQMILPHQTKQSEEVIQEKLKNISFMGGEGLMLRRSESIWEPQRTWNLLKVKAFIDDEATVTGYVWGKGKLEGLMGAIKVEWKGKKLELSGFTDLQRILIPSGEAVPGNLASIAVVNFKFPIGSKISFRRSYELTDDGIPKEARYKE